jgi:hypothetical protein
MDMVLFSMSMVTNMKDIGKMGKGQDKAFISILMAMFMRENGPTI